MEHKFTVFTIALSQVQNTNYDETNVHQCSFNPLINENILQINTKTWTMTKMMTQS
jgi:hypothetical protein